MGSSWGSSEHFLRHPSSSDGDGGAAEYLPPEWAQAECGGGSRRGSRRWSKNKARARGHRRGFCRKQEEPAAAQKRVVVVVDQSSGAKHAMMWALTHVANKGDFLTLLHVLSPRSGRGGTEDASALANSLGALCKACKPGVEVEALVIQGAQAGHRPEPGEEAGGVRARAQPAQALAFLLLHAERQRGVRRGVHRAGGVPDAGGAAAEQGRRRLPHHHPVAEELLAPRVKAQDSGAADDYDREASREILTLPSAKATTLTYSCLAFTRSIHKYCNY